MCTRLIWVVVYARPPQAALGPLFEARSTAGADMIRPRRFQQARRMKLGDRVVIHFGGPSGSDERAQHLVQAGCVKEPARALTQEDAKRYPELLHLTHQGFPDFYTDGDLLGTQGIIFYVLFPPAREVGVLMILTPPIIKPKIGTNFINLVPGHPAFRTVDEWWHRVVPEGRCGNSAADMPSL